MYDLVLIVGFDIEQLKSPGYRKTNSIVKATHHASSQCHIPPHLTSNHPTPNLFPMAALRRGSLEEDSVGEEPCYLGRLSCRGRREGRMAMAVSIHERVTRV